MITMNVFSSQPDVASLVDVPFIFPDLNCCC